MTALEQEIVEKVGKLDAEHQRLALAYIENLLADEEKPHLSLEEWLKMADESRAELSAKYGDNFTVNIQSLLDEVREECLDDLMGCR